MAAFTDPEEALLLRESIETMSLVRGGLESVRRRQVSSDDRRFLTGGRVVKIAFSLQNFFNVSDPSPVRTRTSLPPAPSRPRTVLRLMCPVTSDTVTSRLRMPPSPVCGSISAPKLIEEASVIERILR